MIFRLAIVAGLWVGYFYVARHMNMTNLAFGLMVGLSVFILIFFGKK